MEHARQRPLWWVGLILLGAALLGSCATQSSVKRYALVIGNAAYSGKALAKLEAPGNNKAVLCEELKARGFHTKCALDVPDVAAFKKLLRDFSTMVTADNPVVLVYYTGHGLQVGNENYLLPVNMPDPLPGKNAGFDPKEMMSLDGLMKGLSSIRDAQWLYILDACRNAANLTGTGSRDLYVNSAPTNTMIYYATGSGERADDAINPQGLSLMTKHLVRQLQRSEARALRIEDLMRAVGDGVARESSRDDQRMASYGSSNLQFCVDRCKETPIVIPTN